MRAAVVRNGIVENLIIAGPDYVLEDGCQLVPIGDEPVQIGAAWDGVSFTLPALEIDPSPFEKLVAAGFSPEQAEAILAALG